MMFRELITEAKSPKELIDLDNSLKNYRKYARGQLNRNVLVISRQDKDILAKAIKDSPYEFTITDEDDLDGAVIVKVK